MASQLSNYFNLEINYYLMIPILFFLNVIPTLSEFCEKFKNGRATGPQQNCPFSESNDKKTLSFCYIREVQKSKIC